MLLTFKFKYNLNSFPHKAFNGLHYLTGLLTLKLNQFQFNLKIDLKPSRRARGSYKTKLTLFKQYLEITLSNKNLSNLQVRELSNRLQIIKEMYNDFDSTQTNIETSCDLPDEQQREISERESFESSYFSAVVSAEETLSKHPHISSGCSSTGSGNTQVTGFGTANATGGRFH